jgi:hypothetical protein
MADGRLFNDSRSDQGRAPHLQVQWDFADGKRAQPARAAFHGTAATKRAQYGMGARDNLQEVGDATAPDVDIEIDVEADATSPTP